MLPGGLQELVELLVRVLLHDHRGVVALLEGARTDGEEALATPVHAGDQDLPLDVEILRLEPQALRFEGLATADARSIGNVAHRVLEDIAVAAGVPLVFVIMGVSFLAAALTTLPIRTERTATETPAEASGA